MSCPLRGVVEFVRHEILVAAEDNGIAGGAADDDGAEAFHLVGEKAVRFKIFEKERVAPGAELIDRRGRSGRQEIDFAFAGGNRAKAREIVGEFRRGVITRSRPVD